MPFALILFGMLAIVAAVRDTHKDAQALLLSEFTGPNNFLTWVFAIGGIGAVGYVPSLRPLSRAFLVLIILAMFLSNQGFFARFRQDVLNRRGRTAEPTGEGLSNELPRIPTVPSTPSSAAPSGAAQTGGGLQSSQWWAGGLPTPNMSQQACPPGTTSQTVPGWGGTFRCVPN